MPAVCLSVSVLHAWSCFKTAKIRLLRRGVPTFGLPAGISFDPWNLLVCLWAFGAVRKGRVMPFRLVKARGQIPGDVQSPAAWYHYGQSASCFSQTLRPSGNQNSSSGVKRSRMHSVTLALCLL